MSQKTHSEANREEISQSEAESGQDKLIEDLSEQGDRAGTVDNSLLPEKENLGKNNKQDTEDVQSPSALMPKEQNEEEDDEIQQEEARSDETFVDDDFHCTPLDEHDAVELTPNQPEKRKLLRRKQHTEGCPLNPSRALFGSVESKKPKTSSNTKKRKKREEFDNRDLTEELGVWVQCENGQCNKWRFLKSETDPANIPQQWTCSMHPDETFNSCDKPEEDYSKLEFIHNKFTEGSIVWAKVQGFPLWPAMVETAPDSGDFMFHDGIDTDATHYHCVFLDKVVSRSWVLATSVKKFEEPGNPPGFMLYKKKYSKQIHEARERALEAIKMSIKERIHTFGFSKTFKGVWRQQNVDDAEVTDDTLCSILSSDDMKEMKNETECVMSEAVNGSSNANKLPKLDQAGTKRGRKRKSGKGDELRANKKKRQKKHKKHHKSDKRKKEGIGKKKIEGRKKKIQKKNSSPFKDETANNSDNEDDELGEVMKAMREEDRCETERQQECGEAPETLDGDDDKECDNRAETTEEEEECGGDDGIEKLCETGVDEARGTEVASSNGEAGRDEDRSAKDNITECVKEISKKCNAMNSHSDMIEVNEQRKKGKGLSKAENEEKQREKEEEKQKVLEEKVRKQEERARKREEKEREMEEKARKQEERAQKKEEKEKQMKEKEERKKARKIRKEESKERKDKKESQRGVKKQTTPHTDTAEADKQRPLQNKPIFAAPKVKPKAFVAPVQVVTNINTDPVCQTAVGPNKAHSDGHKEPDQKLKDDEIKATSEECSKDTTEYALDANENAVSAPATQKVKRKKFSVKKKLAGEIEEETGKKTTVTPQTGKEVKYCTPDPPDNIQCEPPMAGNEESVDIYTAASGREDLEITNGKRLIDEQKCESDDGSLDLEWSNTIVPSPGLKSVISRAADEDSDPFDVLEE